MTEEEREFMGKMQACGQYPEEEISVFWLQARAGEGKR